MRARDGSSVWRLTVLAWLCALLIPASGAANQADLNALPVTQPNLCLTCHTVQNPTSGNAPLNFFGGDYLANGRIWDDVLAGMDSDDDGCLNGVEIGDADGDGFADGNVDRQSGNPGAPGDCATGLTDEKTWTALKALFDDRR